MSAVRRAMWWLGVPARAILIGAIHVYRMTLSGWLGGQCRFYPSCSHYAEDAIRVHGAARGSAMAAWRVVRCNPFGAGGVEHVPSARRDQPPSPLHRRRPYEDIIPLRNAGAQGSHATRAGRVGR
jgi:putative membrane protein insertion efficiency factor